MVPVQYLGLEKMPSTTINNKLLLKLNKLTKTQTDQLRFCSSSHRTDDVWNHSMYFFTLKNQSAVLIFCTSTFTL